MSRTNIRERRRLRQALRGAETYDQWKVAALAHDELSGAAHWREEEQTRIYDFAAIRSRLEQLREHRGSGDLHALLYDLNEGIHGNMGNMGREELYSRARFGTKRLITEYIDEICAALRQLAEAPLDGVSAAERLDFFRRASLCFGRSALLLSGGGVFGNFHVGVVRTLIEQDLLPGVISGASAGSLIAGILGTHSHAELEEVFQASELQIRVQAPRRSRKRIALLPRFDVKDIRRHIDRLIPDMTFAEAHQLTGLYINVSVSPAELHQTPRLMNAITSPNVYVRSAVLASCSLPGIYPAVQLQARNRHGRRQDYLPGRRWVDGSISDDVPARRLSRLYAVNHYIVSQVNPLALLQRPPLSSPGVMPDFRQFVQHSTRNAARVANSVVDRYGRRWPELRRTMNGLYSVWAQDYGGDINLLPPPGMIRPWKALVPSSPEELADLIRAGERAVWPRIEMIRNCTKVGRVLDELLARFDMGDPLTQRAFVQSSRGRRKPSVDDQERRVVNG